MNKKHLPILGVLLSLILWQTSYAAEFPFPSIQHVQDGTIHLIIIDTTDPRVHFDVAFGKDNYRKGRETVQSMVTKTRAVAGINTDYFGDKEAEGTTYQEGKLLGDLITTEQNGTCSRTSLGISKKNQATIGWCLPNHTVVGGGPHLLVNGEILWTETPTTINGELFRVNGSWNKPRGQSAAGISQDRRYLILAASSDKSGRIPPITMAETLKKHGAWNAIRLDGGGSSQLYFNNAPLVISEGSSGRKVAESLLVFYDHPTVTASHTKYFLTKLKPKLPH